MGGLVGLRPDFYGWRVRTTPIQVPLSQIGSLYSQDKRPFVASIILTVQVSDPLLFIITTAQGKRQVLLADLADLILPHAQALLEREVQGHPAQGLADSSLLAYLEGRLATDLSFVLQKWGMTFLGMEKSLALIPLERSLIEKWRRRENPRRTAAAPRKKAEKPRSEIGPPAPVKEKARTLLCEALRLASGALDEAYPGPFWKEIRDLKMHIGWLKDRFHEGGLSVNSNQVDLLQELVSLLFTLQQVIHVEGNSQDGLREALTEIRLLLGEIERCAYLHE
ncbi:MAG: hypothetical protein QW420_07460 [Candidatus Caldarchaeum sp.]